MTSALDESMVTNICYNATEANVGLALNADHTTQKFYMSDTRLLVTHAFMDNSYTRYDSFPMIFEIFTK